jgi:hypothetical protein
MPERQEPSHHIPAYGKEKVVLLHHPFNPDAEHIRFVHASLGNPPPSTFFKAVVRGYITGPRQFPRLNTKNVRRHMPNSIATARGHLRKSRTSQPHAQSQSVSALRRYHKAEALKNLRKKSLAPISPFNPTTATKSRTFHFDYTGPLPERCSSGTLYFMVSCWGHYIHIRPLTSLKGSCTAEAFQQTVIFYRSKGVTSSLELARSDNQTSPEIRAAATTLDITIMPVVAFQKESNRAERAVQTAKHHMIATRAGFHRDCPHRYIDMCVPQMELILNILHPFEYDPSISAYHGLCGATFDFMSHPIAPAGSKVLTWDSPDTRGSWADHGTEGIYVGPAMNHFRAFRIWVAQNSAMRVSSAVWWFLPSFVIDNSLLSIPTDEMSYPPTRTRPNPQADGTDLLGRHFFEPDLGVCCVTKQVQLRTSECLPAPKEM